MKTGSSPYRIVLADTPELIHAAYRIRHRAYVERAGFEARDLAEMEVDGFDRRSVHVLAFYHDWPLACVRLVLPPALPMARVCPGLALAPDGGEVGRFSIPAPTSRAVFDVLAVIRCLASGVMEAAERHRVGPLYLLMKPALKGLLKRAGFRCDPIAEAVEFHGRRIPTRFAEITAAEREDGVFQHPEPRAWPRTTTTGLVMAVPAPAQQAGKFVSGNH